MMQKTKTTMIGMVKGGGTIIASVTASIILCRLKYYFLQHNDVRTVICN